MWSQTVTRYRLVEGKVEAKVFHGVHYEPEMEARASVRGGAGDCVGRLYLPGAADIRPGDRVAPGSPKALAWGQLLPGLVADLMQIDYVKHWVLAGAVHHTEAGRVQGPEGR